MLENRNLNFAYKFFSHRDNKERPKFHIQNKGIGVKNLF